MAATTITRHFDAAPEVVFEVFTDFARVPERIEGITRLEVLTDGPVGAGTRFRETRVMFGKEATEEMEITAFDPGRSYTLSSDSCGCEYRFTHRFEPEGGGTRLDMQIETTPKTFMARLTAPISRLVMGGTMRKCIEADMDSLGQAIAERDA